jgi:hypothetical protein
LLLSNKAISAGWSVHHWTADVQLQIARSKETQLATLLPWNADWLDDQSARIDPKEEMDKRDEDAGTEKRDLCDPCSSE